MKKEHSLRVVELYKKEHKRLFAFIRSKISSIEESEDLLQTVYLQLLGNVNVFETIDNLTGWIYTLAKNKIIDWYRRRKPDMISLDESVENGMSFDDLLAEELPDLREETGCDIVYLSIMDSIDMLPDRQKFVFTQQVFEGKTYRELARETGESQNTLIARKRYALSFLRNQLKEIKHLLNESRGK
jgi:RNA polymerase sigma factor (sigma-70 family)